jgi:phosphatidylglycerophosphate synthase
MLKASLDQEETDRLLRPFSRLGLGPMGWSLMALASALGGFLLLALGSLLGGLLLFMASGFIDMVDGAVARATGSSGPAGAFLDGVLDRYVELLLCLGLAAYLGQASCLNVPMPLWILLLLFGSLMPSFIRAYADHRGLVRDPGLLKGMGGFMERGERLLLLYMGMILGLYDRGWLAPVIVLAAVLSNATALQRMLFAIRHGKS